MSLSDASHDLTPGKSRSELFTVVAISPFSRDGWMTVGLTYVVSVQQYRSWTHQSMWVAYERSGSNLRGIGRVFTPRKRVVWP